MSCQRPNATGWGERSRATPRVGVARHARCNVLAWYAAGLIAARPMEDCGGSDGPDSERAGLGAWGHSATARRRGGGPEAEATRHRTASSMLYCYLCLEHVRQYVKCRTGPSGVTHGPRSVSHDQIRHATPWSAECSNRPPREWEWECEWLRRPRSQAIHLIPGR
jgi:hypothetical protein